MFWVLVWGPRGACFGVSKQINFLSSLKKHACHPSTPNRDTRLGDMASLLRIPSHDDKILAWLRSPPPHVDRANVVLEALAHRRWKVVRRAVEDGMLDLGMPIRGARIVGVVKLLHAAAMFAALPLVRYLIVDRGVDPNEEDGVGLTALHYAISERNEAVALFLLQAPSIDIHSTSAPGGVSPLMVAAARGSISIMKALVAKGARVDGQDDEGKTAVAFATYASEEEAAVYLIEEAGAPWQLAPRKKLSAVVQAAAVGQARLLRACLRRMRAEGVSEAVLADHMGGAAYFAARYGKEGALKALADEGLAVAQATVTKRDLQGGVAWRGGLLHRACMEGDETVRTHARMHAHTTTQRHPHNTNTHTPYTRRRRPSSSAGATCCSSTTTASPPTTWRRCAGTCPCSNGC